MSFFSDFILALKFAKEIMFKYKEATKEQTTVKELIYYVFLILVIPSALSVLFFHIGYYRILQLVGSEMINSPLIEFYFSNPYIFLPMFFGLVVGTSILSIILVAGLTHVLARLLRLIQGSYSNTLAAFVYGATPGILISWLGAPLSYVIGNLGYTAVSIATFIWAVTVTVTALENQHKIGPGRALFIFFLPVIVIVIILAAVIFGIPSHILSSFSTLSQPASSIIINEQNSSACSQSSIKMKLLFLDVYDGKDGTAVDFYVENTGKSTLRNIEVVEHYKDLSSETIKFCGNYTRSDFCSPGDERLSIPEGKQVRFNYGTSRSNFTGRIEVLTSCPDVKDEETGFFINDSYDKVTLDGATCNKLFGYVFSVTNLRDRPVSTNSLSVSIDGVPIPDFKIIWGTKFIQPFTSNNYASIEAPETSVGGAHKITLNNINGSYTTEEIVNC